MSELVSGYIYLMLLAGHKVFKECQAVVRRKGNVFKFLDLSTLTSKLGESEPRGGTTLVELRNQPLTSSKVQEPPLRIAYSQ